MSPSSPYSNFVLFCLVSLVLWWHALAATFRLALRNAAYTHILLILPISIALIVSEWRSPKVQPEPNFRGGLALLVLAVLIGLAGRGWWGLVRIPSDVERSVAPWRSSPGGLGCSFAVSAPGCSECLFFLCASCWGWSHFPNLR
jgi:hypothetical protein